MEQWLYAIVLRLVALRNGALPATHGDFTRSALLNLIQKGDTALSAALHDANARKPYTISLLNGGVRGGDGALHFGAGGEALWRFTLLQEAAFDAVLRRYLLDRAQPHVRIGTVEFEITDAYASARSHPDSGSMALSELNERWNRPPEQLPKRVGLEMVSPTTFSLGQQNGGYHFDPMPQPRRVLSTLRKRWLELGGVTLGDAFDEWVEHHVVIDSIHLQRRDVRIKGRSVPASVGRMCYRSVGDQRWWGLVHLLLDLAFWTGIGYQTTAGLGQVRRIEVEESSQ